MNEETKDYIYYIIDTVVLIIAIIFSVTETYGAYVTAGISAALYKVPLILLSVLLKYVYLLYYVIMKFT